jgi:hypothetical protein
MTFHFRVWPFLSTGLCFGDIEARLIRRSASSVRRGPRLIARWQRGSDGHLESRWVRGPD